jgi:hypothetical protein
MLRAVTLLPLRAATAHTRRLRITAIVPRGITTPRRTGVILLRVRTLRLPLTRPREGAVPPLRAAIQRRAPQVEAPAAAPMAVVAVDFTAAVAVAAGPTVAVVAPPTAAVAITDSKIL